MGPTSGSGFPAELSPERSPRALAYRFPARSPADKEKRSAAPHSHALVRLSPLLFLLLLLRPYRPEARRAADRGGTLGNSAAANEVMYLTRLAPSLVFLPPRLREDGAS